MFWQAQTVQLLICGQKWSGQGQVIDGQGTSIHRFDPQDTLSVTVGNRIVYPLSSIIDCLLDFLASFARNSFHYTHYALGTDCVLDTSGLYPEGIVGIMF